MAIDIDRLVFNRVDDGLLRICLAAVLHGRPLTPRELCTLGVKTSEKRVVLDDFLFKNMIRIVDMELAGPVPFSTSDENHMRRWLAENAADCAKDFPKFFKEYAELVSGDDLPALQLFAGTD